MCTQGITQIYLATIQLWRPVSKTSNPFLHFHGRDSPMISDPGQKPVFNTMIYYCSYYKIPQTILCGVPSEPYGLTFRF